MAAKDTKHFATEEWTDFVNGQLSEEKSQAMQAHLNSGCAKCAKSAALWRNVNLAASRESDFEPPASVVRHVRNSFALAHAPQKSNRAFQIPRLVFDSFWQPALAGVRSSAATPRQVVYRAGEIAIEMRIEPEPNSERVNVAGQVSSSIPNGSGVAEISVAVSGQKEELAETSTNQFGEFQLRFVPEEGMHISFEIPQGKDISIPLDSAGAKTFSR